ncbi:MAG: response regulator [Bacteroidota bacterium]|nr:response regulator [Bacteroidota bacterium]
MKILIADDMPDVGKRLERLLRNLPGVTTVNYCASADDAILRLLELQPDLLLLDHRLESHGNRAVLRKVPHYSPHTEVCIYSELLAEIDRSSFEQSEIKGFYEKSGDFDTLLSHVEDRARRLRDVNASKKYVPMN